MTTTRFRLIIPLSKQFQGARTERLIAATVAFALGAVLLFATGFVQPAVAHDSAHDARHAFSLPCH
ncbi:MAG: CbtB-domain containing protein [SAR324 cluster bacterium]|nr:CbtB-domain containing protein [SAR324 cluster bacterium]